jgi:hypothetical protein
MIFHDYQTCIDACVRCAQACEHCASACLHEANAAELAECVRLDRDCAALCWLAAAFLSRGSPYVEDLCRLCAAYCDLCATECGRHEPEHCRQCAAACRHCAEECRRMSGVPV